EVGRMASGFRAMIAYQHEIATAANAMADGDLSCKVEPKSTADVLGTAFAAMIANLRELVGHVQVAAASVAERAAALGSNSGNTGVAAGEVATGVSSVAAGFETTRESAFST